MIIIRVGSRFFGIDRESDEVFADRWIAHAGNELDEFYGGLPAGTVVGVECSGNMLWFEQRPAQYGDRLRLGDTAQIRAKETRKQQHDRRDAEPIARLLLQGNFPDLKGVPTLAERDPRQLLMHRHKMVRMRAQVKNQLQHIALNQGQQKKRKLWTKAGRTAGESPPGALDGAAAGRSVALARSVEPRLRKSGAGVGAGGGGASRRPAADDPSRGPVIRLAFGLTIGSIQRFARSRELVSYLGLNPSENSSGERRRLGGISKQGSSFMRLLLIQGAQTAVRGDEDLRRQHRRLASKKHRAVAKVRVTRKLAVRMFWMLKTQKTYAELVRMRGSSSHPGVGQTDALSERPPLRESSRKARRPGGEFASGIMVETTE